MSQVKQILRMHMEGKGIKTIARALSISKNTVKSYIRKVDRGELSIAEILHEEGPVAQAKLWAGNPSYKRDVMNIQRAVLNTTTKNLNR